MRSPKAVAGVIIVFILGALAGSVGTYSIAAWRFRRATESPRSFSQFMAQRMARRLNLDTVQRNKLDDVLRRSRSRIREIRREIAPRMDAVFHDAEEEISGFLRPVQKKRFEEMIQRRKRFLRARDSEDPGARLIAS